MTFAPVGIKCPDHAGVGAARPRQAPQQTVRSAQRTIAGLDAPATVALVAVNVIIYAITVAPGRRRPRRSRAGSCSSTARSSAPRSTSTASGTGS